MRICVVGLGKIGLPLAVQAASLGHDVIGLDISESVVDLVNRGKEPFLGETDLGEKLEEVVQKGYLKASTDTDKAVSKSEVVVVLVPLLTDEFGIPDFLNLDEVTTRIGKNLAFGTLVCFETTVPVHTTRQRLAPILAEESGFNIGSEVFVAFSPERVSSGSVFIDFGRYPKLVAGIDEASLRKAVAFYESIFVFEERQDLKKPNGVWPLSSLESAEFSKLAETNYRGVNIALANEFARLAESNSIDVFEVIEAANSQPFSHIHMPGISVGGHCIPVYQDFYNFSDSSASITLSAVEVNESISGYALETIEKSYGTLEGSKVVILGASYREGVKEVFRSGVFPLVEKLQNLGATPFVHDPLFEDSELKELGFEPFSFGQPCDIAIVHTAHDLYRELTPSDLPELKIFYDGRSITNADVWSDIIYIKFGVSEELI